MSDPSLERRAAEMLAEDLRGSSVEGVVTWTRLDATCPLDRLVRSEYLRLAGVEREQLVPVPIAR